MGKVVKVVLLQEGKWGNIKWCWTTIRNKIRSKNRYSLVKAIAILEVMMTVEKVRKVRLPLMLRSKPLLGVP